MEDESQALSTAGSDKVSVICADIAIRQKLPFTDLGSGGDARRSHLSLLVDPVQQSGNSCVESLAILGGTRNQLRALHLRQTGMRFGVVINDS